MVFSTGNKEIKIYCFEGYVGGILLLFFFITPFCLFFFKYLTDTEDYMTFFALLIWGGIALGALMLAENLSLFAKITQNKVYFYWGRKSESCFDLNAVRIFYYKNKEDEIFLLIDSNNDYPIEIKLRKHSSMKIINFLNAVINKQYNKGNNKKILETSYFGDVVIEEQLLSCDDKKLLSKNLFSWEKNKYLEESKFSVEGEIVYKSRYTTSSSREDRVEYYNNYEVAFKNGALLPVSKNNFDNIRVGQLVKIEYIKSNLHMFRCEPIPSLLRYKVHSTIKETTALTDKDINLFKVTNQPKYEEKFFSIFSFVGASIISLIISGIAPSRLGFELNLFGAIIILILVYLAIYAVVLFKYKRRKKKMQVTNAIGWQYKFTLTDKIVTDDGGYLIGENIKILCTDEQLRLVECGDYIEVLQNDIPRITINVEVLSKKEII